MSKPVQNVLIIEFSKQILKLNPTLQNFNPVPLSPYLDSEQQIIDFLWNRVDGRMLNVHKDSVIFVRETCWSTNSTICFNVNTSQKKERNIYQNFITLKFQKLMSTVNLKLLKQLSRFISSAQ